jgi:Calcineurin-like phosphoesterase
MRAALNTSFGGLLVAALLAGCAGVTPLPAPDAEPGGRYLPLTTPIIALGDTQEHLSTGFPLHDNDSAVDAYVEVAQRPPEQALFGRRLMEWALHSHPDEPFLHLGDVMDLSCRIEAERMTRIFRAAPHVGAILPGNHDGLMFGIYAYGLLDWEKADKVVPEVSRWNNACRRGAGELDTRHKSENEAFSKREFIALYISEHSKGRPEKPGLVAPPETGRHSVSWRNPDPDAFLSAIEAELLDGKAYADSYIAQRLKLPRAPGATRDTIVIGLDTNQAGLLVDVWDVLTGHSPGDLGHVHHDQVLAVSKWVNEAVERGDIVIFAGHHNWRSISLTSRARIRNLMSRLDHPLVYLSAHTHTGFWAAHRALADQPLLELNVSSLSDWPLAYRRISFAYDETAKRIQVRGELMPKGVKPTTTDADLLEAWDAQTCQKSGVPPARIKEEDMALVKLQRESRGTLLEWLVSWLEPVCQTCEAPLYEHALAYQDELLQTLLQVDQDLGRKAHRLHELKLPKWCAGQDFVTCAKGLIAEQPADFKASTDLFRRKAALVALLNEHLDDLSSPEAKAYMTCRAVQAAKIDFDLTDDERTTHRNEAQRRNDRFFVIEASVGMN